MEKFFFLKPPHLYRIEHEYILKCDFREFSLQSFKMKAYFGALYFVLFQSEWKKTIIKTILKDGNLFACLNYRCLFYRAFLCNFIWTCLRYWFQLFIYGLKLVIKICCWKINYKKWYNKFKTYFSFILRIVYKHYYLLTSMSVLKTEYSISLSFNSSLTAEAIVGGKITSTVIFFIGGNHSCTRGCSPKFLRSSTASSVRGHILRSWKPL